jgi:hypothetical protein
MKLRTAPVIALLALAMLPGLAQASLPSAHSTLIVPNRSLGGVKLGGSLAAATGAWGKGGTCSVSGCNYTTTGDRTGDASFLIGATTVGGPERVLSISIEAGLVGVKHTYNTPLTRFRTANGIGLGSTLAQLHHAYPHMSKEPGAEFFTLKGPGESLTSFNVEEGRVESIKTQSVHLG